MKIGDRPRDVNEQLLLPDFQTSDFGLPTPTLTLFHISLQILSLILPFGIIIMRVKCLFLFVAGFLLMLNASGQQVLTIHGVTSKKLSPDRVSQVVIRNLRSNDIMMSDELGWFTIKAAIGDTILFTKPDYTDQKVVII